MNGTDYDRVIRSECVFLRPDDNMGYPQNCSRRTMYRAYICPFVCVQQRRVPFAWVDISQLVISFANVAG